MKKLLLAGSLLLSMPASSQQSDTVIVVPTFLYRGALFSIITPKYWNMPTAILMVNMQHCSMGKRTTIMEMFNYNDTTLSPYSESKGLDFTEWLFIERGLTKFRELNRIRPKSR